MAPHSVLPWFAGACLLSASATQDADAERFPLAGGVPVGVTVTVKGKFADSDLSNLDFITPDQSLASGYRVRRGSSTIGREVSSGTQSWGNANFALNSDSEVDEFQFLKTTDSFAVSVNGKRTPWYDVDVSNFPDRSITHMNVGSGISDAEVVLKRPACSTPCHPAECQLELGNSTCMVDGEERAASECLTTSPTGCTADTQTDEVGMQDVTCCNGLGRNLRWKDNVNWAWAQVPDDSSIDDACDAYSVDSATCKSFRGKFVSVTQREPASNTAAVWAPTATGCKKGDRSVSSCARQPESIAYNVPMDVLYQRAPTFQRVNLTKAQLADKKGWKFELATRAITAAPSDFPMLEGKFIYLIHENGEAEEVPHGPWTLWIEDRWGFWREGPGDGLSLIVSDFPVELPTCTDLTLKEGSTDPWTSNGKASGDSCDTWCEDASKNPNNMEGAGRGTHVPSSGAWIAQKACCKCGGGTYGGDYFNLPLPYPVTLIPNSEYNGPSKPTELFS